MLNIHLYFISATDTAVFQEKHKYIFDEVEANLKTAKCKSIIRKYE